MCVLCMFFVVWELGGQKNLQGRDFFEKKLVRVGLQETNNFFFRPKCGASLDFHASSFDSWDPVCMICGGLGWLQKAT